MTANKKAIQLVDKYRTYIRMADKYAYNLPDDEIHIAKQCAIIAVNQTIEEINSYNSENLDGSKRYTIFLHRVLYWEEVLKEITAI